ncbi:beta-ketoacyl-[acyl-carrier-protein] synthase family protein [Streptomyces alboniger]|uniref:Beta-ketoacyl-[acyl-carrier-protein] synthase family protein n=1 Tax=Streptomyces alboniger TaxID=132473 RepID=A0A5J6H7V9_STRAD|nr:beta-ketoacyl-[acyl-carrier-protein] synthase family protein [Streptomyces alboniger]QEV16176.1 beta-ketoacyl-[acyl-carrier-protein] synthase family protein [Streptomyces alboniger]
MHRVVITGLGPVSSIGVGAENFCHAVRAGKSGISRISSFDVSGFEHQMAGEVTDFKAGDVLTQLDVAEWGRASLLAAAAARLAADDAGLDDVGEDTAVLMGTTSGEIPHVVAMTESWHLNGDRVPDAALAAQLPAGRLALAAAQELGATGETMTFSAACAAANCALGYAFDLVALGEAPVAVAGGADAVSRFTHAAFHRLGALAKDTCRPFDRERDGMLTAEGGAALVLESLDGARERGARIYAEVLGYALSCDAHHPSAPEVKSIARTMDSALRRSGVRPQEVDYICAHGTGTRLNDQVEAQAIHSVYGHAMPPLSSLKSMLGHTMGAASGFGSIACALAISRGFIPPTINHRHRDPDLHGIDPVAGAAREATVRVAQNNAFGFGGNNAIVVFGSAPCTS